MPNTIAVSGGVDSVTLLDFLVRQNSGAGAFVVAHFNHGTRPSADADATFVRQLAHQYGLPFVEQKVTLGTGASEATARTARYAFLNSVAKDGKIYTAHHLDDLIETIAINLIRGTAWRGLTPFWRPNTVQPFLQLGWTRQDILRYAAKHQLIWRQDPTNLEMNYLRNRLRPQTQNLSKSVKLLMLDLYRQQCNNRIQIEQNIQNLLLGLTVNTPEGTYLPRQLFCNLSPDLGAEILHFALQNCGIMTTRPQIADLHKAICHYAPGKKFNLPHDQLILIRKHDFLIPRHNSLLAVV